MDQSPATRARASLNRAAPRPTATPRKTNRRALILALLLGVVAAVLTVLFLGGRGDASNDAPAVAVPTSQVVVAAREIATGQIITEAMVQLKTLPNSAIINNAATDTGQVVGQIARYPVEIGTQMGMLHLVQPGSVQALSFQIPHGLRAFTIPISVNNTPAALMAPGDFIDLLVSGSPAVLRQTPQLNLVEDNYANAQGNITLTLLQNVQVLALNTSYVDNGVTYDSSVRGTPVGSVSYLTLALTAEQVQLLSRVSSDGQITLSLRRFGDATIEELPPIISTFTVLVATQDLAAGQRVTEEMVELQLLPSTSIIRNAATAPFQVVGQSLRYAVAKGEQFDNLRQADLARTQAFSFQIPDGLRAFTMPVDEGSTPVSLMTPGDYIDILMATKDMDDDNPTIRVETIYENLRVLAVADAYVDNETPYDDAVRGTPPDGGGAGSITLAVTPEQAQEIWGLQIDANVTLNVTLRPYQDAAIESPKPYIASSTQ